MGPLLDTGVAIELRDGAPAVVSRIAALADRPSLSLHSLVELEGGASLETEMAAVRRRRLDLMLAKLDLVGFDHDVVAIYGRIVAAIGFERRPIIDRLIAATALRHDIDLITTNPRDFRPIPGLRLVDWSDLV